MGTKPQPKDFVESDRDTSPLNWANWEYRVILFDNEYAKSTATPDMGSFAVLAGSYSL